MFLTDEWSVHFIFMAALDFDVLENVCICSFIAIKFNYIVIHFNQVIIIYAIFIEEKMLPTLPFFILT